MANPDRTPTDLRRRRSLADGPHSHAGGKWMMLERGAVWGMELNGTEAFSTTSTGYDMYVSLNLATPPSPSYFHLETPDAPAPTEEENGFYGHSSAVAAHRNRLLLQVVVPVEGEFRYTYQEDYFVYTAHRHRPPSLRCLPALPLDDDTTWATWQCHSGEAGILCRGQENDEEYVVAVLQTSVIPSTTTTTSSREVAKLACFFSNKGDNKWEVTELSMPENDSRQNFHWVSDAVFSMDGAICWVNYGSGLLICDVFEDPPVLRFVNLPIRHQVNLSLPKLSLEGLTLDDVEGAGVDCERGQMQSYRAIGITKGMVKFVDVGPSDHGASITTWTLQTNNNWEWHKDSVIDVADLWANAFKDLDLPFVMPELPTLHCIDPNVVYFILKGHDFEDQVWVISLNMLTKTMVSCSRYENHEEDDEKYCYKKIFLCSDLPAYM